MLGPQSILRLTTEVAQTLWSEICELDDARHPLPESAHWTHLGDVVRML